MGTVIRAWSQQQRSGGKIRGTARNHCQTSRRNESRTALRSLNDQTRALSACGNPPQVRGRIAPSWTDDTNSQESLRGLRREGTASDGEQQWRMHASSREAHLRRPRYSKAQHPVGPADELRERGNASRSQDSIKRPLSGTTWRTALCARARCREESPANAKVLPACLPACLPLVLFVLHQRRGVEDTRYV